MPRPADEDANARELSFWGRFLSRRGHREPRSRSFMRVATAAAAESELDSSGLVMFCCSPFVRFWLSLNFVSTRVALISKPTMCCTLRLRYCSQSAGHCAAYDESN